MIHVAPQAEILCLACFMADNRLIRDTMLQPEHFCVTANADMFTVMKALDENGKRVDLLTVADKLGDIDTAANIAGALPSVLEFRHYEGLVVEAWKRRRALELMGSCMRAIDDENDVGAVSTMVEELGKLDAYGKDDPETFEETVMRVVTHMQDDDGAANGIPTGLSAVNKHLFGWQPGSLYIVAARPSVGKTAYALHSVVEAARRGIACSLFAMEMGKEEIIKRMIGNLSRIDGTKMRAPKIKFSDGDWGNVTFETDKMKRLPIDICDRSFLTVADIRSRVRKMAAKHPGKRQLVVVDYLQLMPVREIKGEPSGKGYGRIAWQMKVMAREYKLPVILVSQLNRNVEQRQNKRPMMSDLRESGEIEQHADCIILLHRPDYYDPTDQPNVVEVNVAKQRNGPTGVIKAVYHREFQRFEDIPEPRGVQAQ